MSMTDVDSLTNKVASLLRKAERTDNEHEAAAFAAKAQELMARHAIDRAMVEEAGEGGKEAQQIISRWLEVKAPYAPRKATLLWNVADAIGCQAVIMGAQWVDVIGTTADVEWVETLYASLVAQMEHAAAIADKDRRQPPPLPAQPEAPAYGSNAWEELTTEERAELREQWKAYHAIKSLHRVAQENGRTFKTSFIAGFTSRVVGRLKETNLKAQRDAEQEQGHSVALVLASKAERVEAEFRVRHPHIRTIRRSTRGSGYSAGQNAGSNASFARGSMGGNNAGALGR
jgi:hypothetical protein